MVNIQVSPNYELIAKYGNKSKEGKKVIQYFVATLLVERYALEYMFLRTNYRSFLYLQNELKSQNSISRENAQKILKEKFANGAEAPVIGSFITEERIKELHMFMANGLVDEKNAASGNYRTKPIMTDYESHYPAPEDVPAAMANFVTKYQEFEAQNLNPIALAAWASTQFVLIHPFPDFNGRLSRLLMNMIFRGHGVPIWVSLRSSGKERTKYFTALRDYPRKKYFPIATLMSIQLNQNFEALNDTWIQVVSATLQVEKGGKLG